jgi:hypothetical protein
MILGYSDFLTTLTKHPTLKRGMVIDTNVLISATYDSDTFYDETKEFLSFISEHAIPLFCNVNVRAEFLEIHRRIIFSEALFDFNDVIDKSKLSIPLASQLAKWSKSNKTRKDQGRPPLRLGEADLKWAKLELMKITDGKRDLWTVLCENRIGNKLGFLWDMSIDELGLNFLSLRKGDQAQYLEKVPDWNATIQLIEQHGVSSSDAMILNMFIVSKFDALITSDVEVAFSLKRINPNGKFCFVPDSFVPSRTF